MKRAAKIAWGVVAAATLLAGEEIYNTFRPDTQAEKETLADNMRGALNNISYQIEHNIGNTRPATAAEWHAINASATADPQTTGHCYEIQYGWRGHSGAYTAIVVNNNDVGHLPRGITSGFTHCDGASVEGVVKKIRAIDTELARKAHDEIMQRRNPSLYISNLEVMKVYTITLGHGFDAGHDETQLLRSYMPFPPGPRSWVGKLRARYFTKEPGA